MSNTYDVIIIGSGPSGIACAIYARRFNLKTLIIEKLGVGGQINYTPEIVNYPGFETISGSELADKFRTQAENLGAEFVYDNVTSMELDNEIKSIVTEYSGVYNSKYVVLAMGAKPRTLKLENEESLFGKGVSFCALCDGTFYENKNVVIVGGGNSALEEALLLSKTCKTVKLLHILDTFQGDTTNILSLKNTPNISYELNTQITKLIGDNKLSALNAKNLVTGEERIVETDGLFIAIGRIPNTEIVKDIVKLDNLGYIITDENMKTNIDGVYAIGDIRQKKIRQIATACADGVIAGSIIAGEIK